MANTYELIASSTVGSGGASNIEFTSIPNTFTDLALFYSIRTDRTGTNWDGIRLTPNSSGTTPTSRMLFGTGSATGSEFNNDYYGGTAPTAATTSSTFGNGFIYITNYASSNYKSWSVDAVGENNSTATLSNLVAGLWSVTDAITSLKLRAETTANFVQYSTAYLYGVKNA